MHVTRALRERTHARWFGEVRAERGCGGPDAMLDVTIAICEQAPLPPSVIVPVVQVWRVRVPVYQRAVTMTMAVPLTCSDDDAVVIVLMVLIVLVLVVMLEGFVGVLVLMVLR